MKQLEEKAAMPIQPMSFVAFFTDKKKEDTMGKRTRDEVIYSRVDYRVKQEFESQMKESGYKTSADFIDYLLRGNKGRQIDGTTLKQFMEVMNEVCYELKKQGVNINQLARNINAYPDLISMTAFEPFQRVFRRLEDSVLNYMKGGELDGSIWKCQCKICSMQVCGTASQCCRLYSGEEEGTAKFQCYQDKVGVI